MRLIGILGGMSWVSTAQYYKRLNEMAGERAGGLHSAEILLRSIDFEPVTWMQQAGDWEEAGVLLGHYARRLEQGGAEMILIAANTMHMCADQIAASVNVPLIHIAEATAAAIRRAGFHRPGLIGTGFTMEKRFYRDKLEAAGLSPVIPDAGARKRIHAIIYDELCRGVATDDSRGYYQAVVADLVAAGADCVILGCTEVGMLLNQQNVPVPVFDTVELHCRAAIEAAMTETGETHV